MCLINVVCILYIVYCILYIVYCTLYIDSNKHLFMSKDYTNDLTEYIKYFDAKKSVRKSSKMSDIEKDFINLKVSQKIHCDYYLNDTNTIDTFISYIKPLKISLKFINNIRNLMDNKYSCNTILNYIKQHYYIQKCIFISIYNIQYTKYNIQYTKYNIQYTNI